jgi:hypothetical protein
MEGQKVNRALLCICAVLTVSLLALVLLPGLRSAPPRFQLLQGEYTENSVTERAVFRINTQTGDTKMFAPSTLPDGTPYFAWLYIPEVPN